MGKLYRILSPLSTSKGVLNIGSLALLSMSADKLAVLESVGAIAPVNAPPLAVLTGWYERASVLAKQGIDDAAQFIEHDEKALSDMLKVKVEQVRDWKTEIETRWLTAPPKQ